MCSYERPGWLGCRDLGFSNRNRGKPAGNLAMSTLQPGYRDENNAMHFRNRTNIIEILLPGLPFSARYEARNTSR